MNDNLLTWYDLAKVGMPDKRWDWYIDKEAYSSPDFFLVRWGFASNSKDVADDPRYDICVLARGKFFPWHSCCIVEECEISCKCSVIDKSIAFNDDQIIITHWAHIGHQDDYEEQEMSITEDESK